jgi:hypothetical protein
VGFEQTKWPMAGSIFSCNCWKTKIVINSKGMSLSSTIQLFQMNVPVDEKSFN